MSRAPRRDEERACGRDLAVGEDKEKPVGPRRDLKAKKTFGDEEGLGLYGVGVQKVNAVFSVKDAPPDDGAVELGGLGLRAALVVEIGVVRFAGGKQDENQDAKRRYENPMPHKKTPVTGLSAFSIDGRGPSSRDGPGPAPNGFFRGMRLLRPDDVGKRISSCGRTFNAGVRLPLFTFFDKLF